MESLAWIAQSLGTYMNPEPPNSYETSFEEQGWSELPVTGERGGRAAVAVTWMDRVEGGWVCLPGHVTPAEMHHQWRS